MQVSNARRQFDLYLQEYKPGQTITYHVGDLQRDRSMGSNCLAVHSLARAAWDMMEEGKVQLFQRRVSAHVYAYIARFLPRPYKPVQWEGSYSPSRFTASKVRT